MSPEVVTATLASQSIEIYQLRMQLMSAGETIKELSKALEKKGYTDELRGEIQRDLPSDQITP